MAIIVNHARATGGLSTDINVYTLVLSRLLFLVDDADTPTPTNAEKISLITYEVMLWLNQCFRLPVADVGIEANYTQVQLSLIADVVAYYVLMYRAIALGANLDGYNIISTSSSVSPSGFYIKKADSDETSVEWAVLDSSKNSAHNGVQIGSLMAALLQAMCDKIKIYNCTICRCDDCSLTLKSIDTAIVQPFVILGC